MIGCLMAGGGIHEAAGALLLKENLERGIGGWDLFSKVVNKAYTDPEVSPIKLIWAIPRYLFIALEST